MLDARKGENQNHANVHPTLLKDHTMQNSIFFILLVYVKVLDKLGRQVALSGSQHSGGVRFVLFYFDYIIFFNS